MCLIVSWLTNCRHTGRNDLNVAFDRLEVKLWPYQRVQRHLRCKQSTLNRKTLLLHCITVLYQLQMSTVATYRIDNWLCANASKASPSNSLQRLKFMRCPLCSRISFMVFLRLPLQSESLKLQLGDRDTWQPNKCVPACFWAMLADGQWTDHLNVLLLMLELFHYVILTRGFVSWAEYNFRNSWKLSKRHNENYNKFNIIDVFPHIHYFWCCQTLEEPCMPGNSAGASSTGPIIQWVID